MSFLLRFSYEFPVESITSVSTWKKSVKESYCSGSCINVWQFFFSFHTRQFVLCLLDFVWHFHYSSATVVCLSSLVFYQHLQGYCLGEEENDMERIDYIAINKERGTRKVWLFLKAQKMGIQHSSWGSIFCNLKQCRRNISMLQSHTRGILTSKYLQW